MPDHTRKKEVGRGEKTLPGVWRLRLPLPWPGVPHCNAWALAAGDGVVLVDSGLHEPGSFANLERALAQVNLRVEHVRLLVCTHAHTDHYGQAQTVLDRAGCALWMHPDHAHMTQAGNDPETALMRRLEVARQSGVPEANLAAYQEARRNQGPGVAGLPLPDVELVPGVELRTDLGPWQVIHTPGHAPSHVCLFQPDQRILISGDHLLGRVSLYFDYGWSPDPVGEFLGSLERVQALDARLCLAGHGRSFSDVQGHIDANRQLVWDRLDRTADVLSPGPATAYDIYPEVYDEPVTEANATWLFTQTLCFLRHLEVVGRAERIPGEDGGPERWAAA